MLSVDVGATDEITVKRKEKVYASNRRIASAEEMAESSDCADDESSEDCADDDSADYEHECDDSTCHPFLWALMHWRPKGCEEFMRVDDNCGDGIHFCSVSDNCYVADVAEETILEFWRRLGRSPPLDTADLDEMLDGSDPILFRHTFSDGLVYINAIPSPR